METRNSPFGIADLAGYLAERKHLIAAREGFFDAVRSYLRPEQRTDAYKLGDRLWQSPARVITDEHWVSNPTRGYITVLPDADKGRAFRICVLQQGNVLRIGIRLPAWIKPQSHTALTTMFPGRLPNVQSLPTDETFIDWEFDASNLYNSAQEMETAIYRIGALVEKALQHTVPMAKE